jgi:hypothetical protein
MSAITGAGDERDRHPAREIPERARMPSIQPKKRLSMLDQPSLLKSQPNHWASCVVTYQYPGSYTVPLAEMPKV